MTSRGRRHLRCSMANFLYAIVGADSYRARTRDVSAGGAALMIDAKLAVGDRLRLIVDGIGLIPAEVVRLLDGGVAVRFLIDEARGREVEGALLGTKGAWADSAAGF